MDANVSLLVVVGSTNPDYTRKHKRLQGFDKTDFETISEIVAACDAVLLTPNVLSETSNLLRYVSEPIKSELAITLRIIISNVAEKVVASKIAVDRDEYLRLGLTDSVLLELACSGATLLTIDLDLYLAALRCGFDAINYNHIKDQRPDLR